MRTAAALASAGKTPSTACFRARLRKTSSRLRQTEPRPSGSGTAALFFRRLLLALLLLTLIGCQRERRDLRPSPTRLAIFSNAAPQSILQPGGPKPMAAAESARH